ncbi:MAG: hypothetical protein NW205_05090 [Hyphomicrobiaceae bacterium]|nr:hypothetical protein [Hyphomicrobiaceae bacterium]
MAQYPSVIELSSLNGANGFEIRGSAANDFAGRSVAVLGDINGDGFDDILIGANGSFSGGNTSGSSYVVFGTNSTFSGVLNLYDLNGTNGFNIPGEGALHQSGYAVGAAGDVNGDGLDDLLIGSWRASPNGSFSGASYVVFGRTSGFSTPFSLSGLDGTNGFQVNGEAASQFSGSALGGGGDINGDGFDDIIIGAFGFDPNGASTGGENTGAAFVVLGQEAPFAATIQLSALNGDNGFQLSGASVQDFAGRGVAIAGDINGDGFDDALIGAYGTDTGGVAAGTTYVLFGSASGFAADTNLSALSSAIIGAATSDASGRSVAAAGDVNADGLADIIIGASGADPNGNLSGAAYVVFGRTSGFGTDFSLGLLNGTDGFRISGEAADDGAGFNIAAAGDVNGDGFDDVIVGAYSADPNGSFSGSTYVVFGGPGGFPTNVNLSSLNGTNGFQINGEAANDYAGRTTSAGDINGDGLSDIIIGAFGVDANGSASGATYVVFGRIPDAAVVRFGTAIDQNLVGGNFSDRLSGLGGADKLYGNGGNDFLFGGDGNDILRGAAGNDIMAGGRGRDTLIGFTGNDRFDFNATNESVRGALRDVINDFRRGDRIDLATIDAETGGSNQRFDFIGNDGFSRDKGELRVIEQAGARCLVQADTNGDGRADLEILVLGVEKLNAGDFVL